MQVRVSGKTSPNQLGELRRLALGGDFTLNDFNFLVCAFLKFRRTVNVPSTFSLKWSKRISAAFADSLNNQKHPKGNDGVSVTNYYPIPSFQHYRSLMRCSIKSVDGIDN